jgi:hypothetical protein
MQVTRPALLSTPAWRTRYSEALNAFQQSGDNEEALRILRYLNPARYGAPKVLLFGMCLSGAFSGGGQALFDRLATIKFQTPITADSLSYLAARQRWANWWMRIFRRNILDVVAKSIASGIRIFNALAPTAQPCQCRTAKLGGRAFQQQ